MKFLLSKSYLANLLIVLIVTSALFGVMFARNATGKGSDYNNENYIASSHLDVGNYAKGRTFAQAALEMRNNDVSKELIALSYCYEHDFDEAVIYGQANPCGNGLMEGIVSYATSAKLTGGDNITLLSLHSQVKQYINISTEQLANILAAESILSDNGDYGADYYTVSTNLETLKNSGASDSVSLKAMAYGSYQTGSVQDAYNYMQRLVATDNTEANQIALANFVAENYNAVTGAGDYGYGMSDYGSYDGWMSAPADVDPFTNTGLAQVYSQAFANVDRVPYEQALSYLEVKSGLNDNSAAFNLAEARLHYLMGDKEEAEALVKAAFTQAATGEDTGYLSQEILRLLNSYDKTFEVKDEDGYVISVVDTNEAALAVEYALTQGMSSNQYDNFSFKNFLMEVLEGYKGVISINSVDASAYPYISVHFTSSLEEDAIRALVESDFEVMEQNAQISDFELIKEIAEGEGGAMSVCFVLDVSGSMDGSPLANSKSAAKNFLNYVDGNTELAVVQFDSYAEIKCNLTTSTGVVAAAIDSSYAGGGTSIATGLAEGIKALSTAKGNKVIILLSDGADGDSYMIEGVKSQLKAQDITVYAIGVGGCDEAYLESIAYATGGSYFAAEDSASLGSVYKSISRYVGTEYCINFNVINDQNNYDRTVTISLDSDYGIGNDTLFYSIGVSPEQIAEEEQKRIEMNFYRQIGGSKKGVQ